MTNYALTSALLAIVIKVFEKKMTGTMRIVAKQKTHVAVLHPNFPHSLHISNLIMLHGILFQALC